MTLKHQVFSGMLWQFMERFGAQFIQFFCQVILARLLTPDNFGVIAVVSVFITLSEVFVDSGFRSSLIQRKELDPGACQSVFWLNLSVSLIVYGICFFIAPWAAEFYHNQTLVLVLRVLALVPVIHGFTLVHNAILLKRMLFKKRLLVVWSGILISAAVGIGMAFFGCGVWAMVAQQLVQAFVSGMVILWVVRWRPSFHINFSELKPLFRFGSYMLGISLLSALVSNSYRLIIGRLFSLETLGFFNMGNGIPRMAMSSVNNSISTVSFSTFSIIQGAPDKLRGTFIRMIDIANFSICPLLFLLTAIGPELVRTLLGEKWLPAAIFLQINSLAYLFWPSHILNAQVCMAEGKSKLCFQLELLKDVVLFLLIFLTYRFGVVAMSWGAVGYSAVSFVVNSYPNRKIIGYGPWRQFLDLLPALVISGIACLLTMAVARILPKWPGIVLLVLQVLVFGVAYLGLNYLFRRSFLLEIIRMGHDIVHGKLAFFSEAS